jgi:hypothetical protein
MVMEIQGIFPTPIGFVLNEQQPLDEHQYLLGIDYHLHKDYGMTITKNKFILNSPIPSIRNFIEKELKEYALQTLGTSQPLRFTQSWCTKHENIPQETFPHTHQNSIISGVYYVQADSASEGITFYKNTDYTDRYVTWQTESHIVEQNHWAWRWAKYPVQNGLLILFPSQLKHAVEGQLVANNVRCSLAFNTWFVGPIGNEDDLSQL